MGNPKLYIETYGCQMNTNDSEVVASVLCNSGFEVTETIEEASLIILNTCAVRDHAENKIFQRLIVIKKLKTTNHDLLVGVIGCMAERLKEQLFERNVKVDIVCGPDSYRKIPELVAIAGKNNQAINVHLSDSETYSDISPMHLGHNRLSAFISIMRGCDNFCTYCIVPYTRGRERSRDAQSIIEEAKNLEKNGFKEVTLLGQNVNSYNHEDFTFPKLMEAVAQAVPSMRVRFTTSHPKDLSNDLLVVMAANNNICKNIHLPVQSGSTNVLELMNRKYTREWYLDRIAAIKQIVPDVTLSTDILSGFCNETEEDHQDTLSLMKTVGFDTAFMFKYSVRPGTLAEKRFEDNIPEDIKLRRLNEIINLQNELSSLSNEADIDKTFEVLVEGISKKSKEEYYGRTSQNKVVVFPKGDAKIGDFVNVKIKGFTSATLMGENI